MSEKADFHYLLIPADIETPLKEIEIKDAGIDELFTACRAHLFGATPTSDTMSNAALVRPSEVTEYNGTFMLTYDVALTQDEGMRQRLGLNVRASDLFAGLKTKVEIIGDVFLVCYHEEPNVTEWKGINCSAHPHYEGMLKKAMDRVSVTFEEAFAACQARQKGNDLFVEKDYTGAIAEYSAALRATEGSFEEDEEVKKMAEILVAMRVAALSNRALCYNKLERFALAEADLKKIIGNYPDSEEPSPAKVLFRLAQCLEGQKDYDQALSALSRCEQADGPADDIATMRASLRKAIEGQTEEERKLYSKMF